MAAASPPMKLFMKTGCPFCSKLACFLGEANLMDKVSFEPDDEANRAYVTEKCGKASFPALEYEPGSVMLETDDIIKKFCDENNVDCANLSGWQFIFGPEEDKTMFKTHIKLFKYGMKNAGGYAELIALLNKPDDA
eukprot:CAMPEP_0114343058 /NCGR_PEP_ID=MMETSP0101-20121206/10300_1 /TAXON_ID=38822 ORGANISM="Pteridomonas danica, Strain PT" /NCGR_SAMPLE_ID=MMETSP0101 /ASSEMBLY_ACC=CAM_ASM_000211 /LENGTH=135 /DNA_ID=CAMNT_0001477547 /DNA_START=20 /DNA_END=427 /DNA_ORIENTATION=-